MSTACFVVPFTRAGNVGVCKHVSQRTRKSAVCLSLQPLPSLAVLNAVTILWGSQHAVIKGAITNALEPSTLNLCRFGIAALLFSPFLSRARSREWRAGAELALWTFGGYALQAIALTSTSATRSGFLLYLNVKLVPVFAYFIHGKRVSTQAFAAAFTAFLGTCVMSFDAGSANIGDVQSVLAACASAMFILRLERLARNARPAALTAVSMAFVCAFSAVWALASHAHFHVNSEQAVAVLYLGAVTTALTHWLQTLAQRHVSAEKAAVVYAMDPVYGALFANILLGESFGTRGLCGAALIFAAALVSNADGNVQMEQNAHDLEDGNVSTTKQWGARARTSVRVARAAEHVNHAQRQE